MRFSNWQNTRLHGREPKRECSRVMFDKKSHASLYRAYGRTVHDKGTLLAAVLPYVGKVKAVRHAKIVLHGKGRVLLSVGVLHLHVYFWAVKSRLAIGLLEFLPASAH